MIFFTKHAREKFKVLKAHKFSVTRSKVMKTLRDPDHIDRSRFPILIAERGFDEQRVLRVVYKREGNDITVITFYPAKRGRYE
ncbi:MAG: DUF4258 domain-containing protein [Patescibacteria group bacterium]